MKLETEPVVAKVYKQIEDKKGQPIYYVGIVLPFIEITNITVRESLKHKDKGWWIQMPSYPTGGGRTRQSVNFPDTSEGIYLQKVIWASINKAVDDWVAQKEQPATEENYDPFADLL